MSRIAVIGLGQAGCGYDFFGSQPLRSHVGVSRQLGFEVTGLVDPNLYAHEQLSERFPDLSQVRRYRAIEDLEPGHHEVIVLATPPDNRYEQIKQCLDLGPRVIIIEKPLALTADDAQEIMSLFSACTTEARVNFHRRFDPSHVAARKQITEDVKRVVMSYGKGLFNYGSHLIDLLIDWFGEVQVVNAIVGFGNETNPSFLCHTASGVEVFISGFDGLEYDQFEIDVYMQRKKMEISAGGCCMRVLHGTPGKYYPGYTHLGDPSIIRTPGPVSGLPELYESVSGFLESNKELGGCKLGAAAHGIATLEAVAISRNLNCAVAPAITVNGFRREHE